MVKWWRELRWQLIGAQMVVVVVGVLTMLLISRLVFTQMTSQQILPILISRFSDRSPEAVTAVAWNLVAIFRQTVILSVVAAATGALLVGTAVSLFLTRRILRPLDEIARGSQRIADGRYDERVTVPTSTELAQVAAHFNQMAASLAEVEQQRVTLLGNISHELRTPLTGLKGYLEGLMDGLFPNNEETFAWMSREVGRLGRLVDNIQYLSRVEAGQIHLHLTSFPVQEVAQQVVAQLQPQAAVNSIVLTLQAPEAPLLVYADPDCTAQVLLNLLGNALRYTPENGRITLTVQSQERQAQLVVTDTGSGIPAEALPFIFERFYRVDQSRARVSGGSGIGLTISRHLVWAMGGELSADSAGLEQGSTFTFTLPLAS